MKIKLDENLPFGLTTRLAALGHEAQTPREEGLAGVRDFEIWEAAQREGRFLVTQDLDFSDARRFLSGTHHGLLLVRLQTPTRTSLIDRIKVLFRTENVEA